MITIFFLRDLDNQIHHWIVDYDIEENLDGNEIFSAEILPNEINNEFLRDLKPLWKIEDKNEESYTIVVAENKKVGKFLTKQIKAIPTWIDKLSSTREYLLYKPEYYSLDSLLKIVFQGTGYGYEILGDFGTIYIEGFGKGDTRLELLKRILKRYDAEFEFKGRVCSFKKRIGIKKDVFLHHKLNLSNVSKSVSCEDFYTYAVGYGDFDEEPPESAMAWEENWEFAKLTERYTSPLAKLLGEREAPPIKDGRISVKSFMQDKLKELVDKSIVITIDAKILNLKGEFEEVNKGDIVQLNDEVTGVFDDVRVIKKLTYFDHKGQIKDTDFVFQTSDLNVF